MRDAEQGGLIGRMATDPELATLSGHAVTTFRVAVNRPFTTPNDRRRGGLLIDIVAWRQSAEFAANYLTKGRLIAVEGRLQSPPSTDRDGNKRRAAEVVW